MELKNHFKKFGMGWIILGVVLSISFFILSGLTEYLAVNKLGVSYWSRLILFSILIGLGPFILGFFGLYRLFWLLVGWEIIALSISYLTNGPRDMSFIPFLLYGLFAITTLIGVIWEIIYHYRSKKGAA